MAAADSASNEPYVAASFWRRLLSMVYDGLVLICLVFIAWQPVPLIPDDSWPSWLSQLVRMIYLILIIFGFLGWFWTHGGQTVGMRAWKIRVIADQDAPGDLRVTWVKAAKRFGFSILSWLPLGLGFLWSLFNADHKAWHDSFSGTRLVEVV